MYQMKTLWTELRKIQRQIRGKENIFGYKSTEANQLYLLYCSAGKIYFTDKIHRKVKYLWLVPVLFEISFCYFAIITNLWYGFEKNFMVVFDIMNLKGVCLGSILIIPLISYLFREDIEAMITTIDEIIVSRLNSSSSLEKSPKNIKNIKKIILCNTSIFSACLLVTFLYLFDTVIFFEKWKIDNRHYYMTSVPLIEQFRSKKNYFIFNFLNGLAVVLMFGRYVFPLFFMIYWSVTCHNELTYVINEINTLSNNLNAYIGHRNNPSVVWDQHFAQNLTHSIKRFQKIITAIDNFRGYFETISTIAIPTSFFVIVAQLHVTLTENLPLILKLKSIAYCLSTAWCSTLVYWTAQMLEISVFNVSLAVYSTPWYRSIMPRKNIQIFLCRSQKMNTLKIIKVHSLLLQNFSRYLHGILSVSNAIRKLTEK